MCTSSQISVFLFVTELDYLVATWFDDRMLIVKLVSKLG